MPSVTLHMKYSVVPKIERPKCERCDVSMRPIGEILNDLFLVVGWICPLCEMRKPVESAFPYYYVT